MDVQDVDVVIVYDLPSTLTQFYQVYFTDLCPPFCVISIYLLKFCGRAGRSGHDARAHLFYAYRKEDYKDKSLRDYVECGENCRRKMLLNGMGGSFSGRAEICCDICTPLAVESRLDILKPGQAVGRKRRRAVRDIDDSLKEILMKRLSEERDCTLREMPSFRIFGEDFILPDTTILELCCQSCYITAESDICLYGIRPDVKERLFNVIIDVVSSAPPPRKKHRK